MRFSLTLPLFTPFAVTTAHGTHRRRAQTLQDLAREEIRAREHAVMARNCEQEIREHVAMRMRRRAEIQKREAEDCNNSTSASPAEPPHFTNIQNTTCLTAPEVVEGPYYVNNAFVRQNIRESQEGVQLLMDFGVLDTTTCAPMNNAFVVSSNATGEYGGYSSNGFDESETWLRGGWYTDTNGMVEVTTVHPGYYNGRTPHIHIMVHKDWSQSDNGTIASHSGSLVHVGQTFFDESWNDQVFQTHPYSSNVHNRTLNTQDSILDTAFKNGYSAYTSLQFVNGQDISGGLVGYLTLGVDPRSAHTINNKNYVGQGQESSKTRRRPMRRAWVVGDS